MALSEARQERLDVKVTGFLLRRASGASIAEIEDFRQTLAGIRDAGGLTALVERWGIRRTSPRFWEFFDRVHADFRRREPIDAGLLDLNRYENL